LYDYNQISTKQLVLVSNHALLILDYIGGLVSWSIKLILED